MNVSSRKIGKMAKFSGECFLGLHDIVGVAQLECLLQALGVDPPHLERVVHSTGHDHGPRRVEICAEYFVSVALYAAENGNAMVCFDIPKTKVVIF